MTLGLIYVIIFNNKLKIINNKMPVKNDKHSQKSPPLVQRLIEALPKASLVESSVQFIYFPSIHKYNSQIQLVRGMTNEKVQSVPRCEVSKVTSYLAIGMKGYLSVWRHHFFTHFYKKGYINQVNQILYYFISNEKVVAPYGNFSGTKCSG